MNVCVKYGLMLCLIAAGETVFGQGIKDTVMQIHDVLIEKQAVDEVKGHIVYDNTLADLSQQEGRKLSDVLNDYSGIYLKNYGVGQLSSISINGASAAQTDITWNGVKLNSPTTGQVDLSLFDVSGGDDIRIITTAQGGNVGIGGTLSLSNPLYRLHSDENIRSYNTIRIGSFGERVISTSDMYGVRGFKGATKLAFLSADNDFPFVNDTKIGAPTVRETNAATKQLSFTQQLQYSFRKPFVIGAELWITDADRQLPPVMTSDVSHEHQWDQSYRSMAYLKGSHKGLFYSFTTAYLYDKLKYTDPTAYIDSRSSSQALRNNFFISNRFNYGFTLNGSVHYDHESAKSTGFDTTHQRDLIGANLGLCYAHKSGFNTEASIHEEWLGTQALPTAGSLSAGMDRFIGRGDLQFKVGGEHNYRLPALNDLYWNQGGNPNLRPEKAWKGFAHIYYEYSYWLRLIGDVHYNYVTDWILWHPTQSGIWMPDNVRRVLSRGATIDVHMQSKRDKKDKGFIVSGYVSYSYTQTVSLDAVSANDNSQGKQLIYVPLHILTASIKLQYRHFYIMSMHSYTGVRYTATDDSESLPGYYLIHLEAGKDFYFKGQQMGVSFRINNVANTQYQAVADRPMPGRSFEGTVRINLVK